VTSLNPPVAEAVRQLRSEIAGTVILPDDHGYDGARGVWNAMIDRRPMAIIRAAAVGDIAPVLRTVRDLGIPLAIRGGGHNVAGNGTVDDGIVLDMGALTAVDVDPAARTVRVEPGATLADVDRATEPHGLAVPIGVVSATGVAGLTLGGGVGWLTRAYGLTADNLLAADLVTADGEAIRASESENPDLLWGLKGGGGNFGVASSFTFRAYPLGPDVLGATFIYGRDRWVEALRAYDRWTRELPDELTTIVTVMVPPVEWEMGDDPLLFIAGVWSGDDRDAPHGILAALRAVAPPDQEVVELTRWTAWQTAADDLFPSGVRAYWKNTSFDRLDDEVIETIIRHGSLQTWRGTAFDIHHLEGAYGRIPEDATPFPNRAARFWLNIYGFWADPADDPERIAFVRRLAAAMEPFATGGQYVNFLGHEETARDGLASARAVYGQSKLERLVNLKRRYDPRNVFRLNHNIPPG
jgi:FAD/FMN-containing dehydrogenase